MHMRSFETVVMFFGMMNSSATFYEMMNETIRDLINEEKMVVFVDNVLVGTEEEKGHDKIVVEVLKRLEENNLYMKPEKCTWKINKVNFLGIVMGQEKIEIEKEKVEGVLNWLIPKIVKDIRKFLELTNYYRRFIKNFAVLAKPLNMLTRKEVK